MKKILLSFLLLFLFLIPDGAKAISGACSDHLGVNCSAGADKNGYAICNDGQSSNSVLYTDMIECDSYLDQGCINYILGRDQMLSQINKMIEDAETKSLTISDPYSADDMKNYLNYLYVLKGRQIKNYTSYARECTKDILKLKEDCRKKDGIPGAESVNVVCNCVSGYQWDQYRTTCEKIPNKISTLRISTLDIPFMANNTDSVSATKTFYISVKQNVNIRQKAEVGAKILGVLKPSNKYKVLDNTNKEWVKIKFNNIEAWVVKRLVIIK